MVETHQVARETPGTIVGLDVLRFAAAFLVVLYHLAFRTWAPPIGKATIRDFMPASPPYPELEPVAWLGWIGVQIFFVISGFVIAHSAENKSAFAFLRSRFLRLAPGIWICATITLAVYLSVKGLEVDALKRYVRTIAIPVFFEGPWIDSVYWTLVVEMAFYLVVFLMLLFDRFNRIEVFMAVLAFVSGGLWIVWAVSGFGERVLTDGLGEVLLLRHGCYFAFGIGLWLVLYKRVTAFRLLVMGVALAGCLAEINQDGVSKAEDIGRNLSAVAAQAVFLVAVGAIIASVVFNRAVTAGLRGAGGLTRSLGLMTYPLYLVHNVVGVAVLNGLVFLGLGKMAALAAAVAAMVALAWLISSVGEPLLANLLRNALRLPEAAGRRVPSLQVLFRSTRPVPA